MRLVGNLQNLDAQMADVFSIRYSTKYFDPETGFYYYGYRFYSPELMRWITRDLIGEDGGVNLYAMCGNDSVSFFDALGMWRMINRKIAVPGVGDVVSRKSNLDQRMTDLLKVLTEKYKKMASKNAP